MKYLLMHIGFIEYMALILIYAYRFNIASATKSANLFNTKTRNSLRVVWNARDFLTTLLIKPLLSA